MSDVVLHHGDCMEVMRGMEAGSVDAVVTDPPYGLEFMGKEWDHGVPGEVVWREVIRVLKPGGHLLAFGGTRTAHRMVCAIEDAGFEVRDTLMWVYGTGFPKSLDVSKAIDKAAGAEGESVGGASGKGTTTVSALGDGLNVNFAPRPRYVPATPEAEQWQGWGTALKPAYEPIVLARKPLVGTVAQNVLAHGTGAINVDACRVGTDETIRTTRNIALGSSSGGVYGAADKPGLFVGHTLGRWPANVIHDGSDEVVAGFPNVGKSTGGRIGNAGGGAVQNIPTGKFRLGDPGYGDSGSAARFFYCAKASKADRAGSKHPTVKPVSLMRYLCRLVTPPGGVVLDPFAGSGTTGQAAREEGFAAVLIEREAEYAADIRRRLAQRQPTSPAPAPVQEALML